MIDDSVGGGEARCARAETSKFGAEGELVMSGNHLNCQFGATSGAATFENETAFMGRHPF